jgi:hypothetical protein
VKPANEQVLVPLQMSCPDCGHAMRIRYTNQRAIVSLRGLVCLRLKIRRCETCGRYHQAWRPEGSLALPQHEFGLDVIALIGNLRYREHRSVPEIHRELDRRGDQRAQRPARPLRRAGRRLGRPGGAPRNLGAPGPGHPGGLQPDVGHEVLWVIRDCLSGLVLLALLSSTTLPACCARSPTRSLRSGSRSSG